MVTLSPLVLSNLDDNVLQADWGRLSDIGQTYGAVSAVIAAIALVGIVASLIIQSREAKAARTAALRTLHVDLLRMSMEDPAYMECWGVYLTESFEHERQYAYVNLIINHWHSMYELGECTDKMLSAMCAEVFSSAPGRTFWRHAGPGLMERASRGKDHRFYYLIDVAYHKALEQPPAVPPAGPTKDETSRPTPVKRNRSGMTILLTVGVVAGISFAFRIVRDLVRRIRGDETG